MNYLIAQIIFLLVAIGLVLCLKLLSSPKSARLGNLIGAASMGVAILFTIFAENPQKLLAILLSMSFGALVGFIFAKKVKMTAMPQLVAILNSFGGLASVLVSYSEAQRFFWETESAGSFFAITSWLSVTIGAITFSGSIIAFLKLQGLMPAKPILLKGQRFVTGLVFLLSLTTIIFLVKQPENINIFLSLGALALFLGVLLVIPIGGADMPVVISLLNSYSGIAAMAAGFVVNNNLLIIAGALVGTSGIILTRLMCQAMNRSLFNVVFGAFGGVDLVFEGGDEKPMREFTPMDAAMIFNNASKVIIVPGYGLAVSQAQRNLRELSDELKSKGIDVSYAIHPVAGRMPGHMNVLLAEADVPYNELYDLDDINGEFESADVALIVGANDVVNPSARDEKNSPLYGMPVLNADKAKTVIVLKRGKGRGFAGVENPLFTLDNSGVVFGDAKSSLVKIIQEVKTL